jgi:hypothetical protein
MERHDERPPTVANVVQHYHDLDELMLEIALESHRGANISRYLDRNIAARRSFGIARCVVDIIDRL